MKKPCGEMWCEKDAKYEIIKYQGFDRTRGHWRYVCTEHVKKYRSHYDTEIEPLGSLKVME